MLQGSDDCIDDMIYVPEGLLTAEAAKGEGTYENRPARFSFTPHDWPVGDVDIAQRGQRRISWALDEQPQFCLEEARRTLRPVAEHSPVASETQDDASPPTDPYYHGNTRPSAENRQSETDTKSPQYPEKRSRSFRFSYRNSLPLGQSLRNTTRDHRKGSIKSVYNRATLVKIKHQRRYWRRLLIEYAIYAFLAAVVYFVLIGVPLWKGAVYWLYWTMQHKMVIQSSWAIFLALLVFYSFAPLLVTFEKDAPGPEYYEHRRIARTPTDTALIIPCYKSAPIIGRTLEAALKIFPASHIYVVANGNSPSPIDATEDICRAHGVNHIWAPVGSKIIALFIGCYAVKQFRHVLLIDDDCILPPNFPIVAARLTGKVRCIGYTIKSVGRDSSLGTYCQQAQDLEYKLSGLQRLFAGRMGSATFPHGAISLWQRSFLKETLHNHPGFSISEDWFLGDSCRRLGGRILMCSAAFVETTTPASVLFATRSEKRGGFGEATVFKQRFLRWNFFVASGLWHNLRYLVGSWKLGWWEFGTKIFVFQEIYENLLYILTPFILPISFIIQSGFFIGLAMATLGFYMLHIVIFNEVHLRRRQEQVCRKVVLVYYMPYKLMMTLTNIAGCYWSLFRYARYFARRRPKLTEDHKAVGMVLRLEEMTHASDSKNNKLGRSLTVRAVNVRENAGIVAELSAH
ncbi:glycosyltransferase family 2 protein [Aspergillus clavatus NRRL 1]|uniref:Glycosyl transferase, group 2 family protein n=1 Tax=Aspergillus clavatus (strain ATCC 1007 / CBS 513.65 / DSM 816 / NCTC 3887 / NRRL 1 / QM 1276 / 107) TaxID=344612 RepID=A1C8N3_ASPCL|nr:glycosyl transferase, group 2 family protein [Aspergillus clavatus NRRL 1]EAW13670.1 glycosyl transferase, group 2 family protein [Aspergillus clavatus NRRL 1]